MVAFRKWFPVLAIFALLMSMATTASAQTATPLTCIANAGVPPIVRAEGFTELTGDVVLVCTGGNPAAPFLANFQIFLNTNITSRLVGGGLSEALLLIDEPLVPRTDAAGGGASPATPLCLSPSEAANSTIGGETVSPITCQAPAGAVNTAGTGAPSTYQRNRYTAFRAARAAQGENSIVWAGVPIVPPGTTTRTIRFTNIRANAAGLGTSNTLIPTQIVAFISVSASQSVAINNPQQTVAYIQQGLQFEVRGCSDEAIGTLANFFQCVGQNTALFTDPNRGVSATNLGQFALRFREGFQTAFKAQIDPGQLSSVPGTVYNTESGFVRQETGFANVGIANSGTRLAARFNNVPAGVRIFVTTGASPTRSSAGTSAVLIQAGPSGEGGIATSGSTSVLNQITGTASLRCTTDTTPVDLPAAEVPITNGTGVAVWEVTSSNPSTIDTAFFLAGVAYTSNTPNNLPGIGVSSVTGNFAPFYAATSTANVMSSTLPIPRFVDNPISRTDFRIDECATNLLFPFVTNQAGFDTGIAISNTSRDIFANQNTRLQSGTCTINYFGGTAGGGAAPAAQTTNANVEAGSTLTFVLSSGGGLGVAGTPGFQGYIIARCRFQYAHGFAFITDGPIGQANVAEGYLALVLDSGISARGSFSEVLSH